MIIDKSKLDEAKKALGDRTPDLIAEIMGLEQYDSKNRKALCPFHREDTPSFIWNPKLSNFHCFGCGANLDIIDAYMHTGLTFAESCEKVFEEAGVSYAFGEKGVRTKSQYRYPKLEQNEDMQAVYEYWDLRKISPNTLDAFDVRQDSRGNTVFNYYDLNDVLTMVKYKPSHKIDKKKGEIKSWCQKDADTTPLLFNMNRVNPEQPLLITEGEPDALAAYQSGYHNVVSVPLGANNYQWIEENWDFLEQFKSIILGFDNDEAGQKALKEVIYRLGSWRTKIMDIPEVIEHKGQKVNCKDINELLYFCGEKAVMDAVVNAKDSPVTSVIDFSDVQDIDLIDMDGIETGYQELDRELMRIFYGTLTILTGQPSAGKSSFINQLIANSIDQDKNVWLYSKEMPEYITSNWSMLSFAGPRNIKEYVSSKGTPYYKIPESIKSKIRNWARGKLFIYKDESPNELEEVYQSMEACVRKYGVKLLIIDNLMMLNMNVTTSDGKYEKQREIIKYLIDFAQKYNVAVILVAHPRKMMDTSQDVGTYDISGTSDIINLTHRSIGLRRVSKKEKEKGKKWGEFDVVLTVIKDRLLGKNEFSMGFHYDMASRRFFTNYEEYSKQFGWDDTVYDTELPVPDCLIDKAMELYKNGDEENKDYVREQ